MKLFNPILRVRAWHQRGLIVRAVRQMPVPKPSKDAKKRLLEVLAAEGCILTGDLKD